MTDGIPERRRSQRATIGSRSSWLAVPATWPVQLLDVSMGGLAFASPYRLDIGRTASVRATLGRDAFNGQIRVCWSRPRSTTGSIPTPFEIGAVFLQLEEGSRHALETFLRLSHSGCD
jgi:PilZ domain